MEYKKDKRTENLTLRDIHVGDWVQVWSETTECYSPPRKITQICDDGAVYLEGSEEERPTLWVEDIKNVDALDITPELLKGFGFEVIQKDYPENVFNVLYNAHKIGELWKYKNERSMETPWNSYIYYHELLNDFREFLDYFPELLSLEWKGVQS